MRLPFLVELILCLVYALFDDTCRSVQRAAESLVHHLFLGGGKVADDPIHHLVLGMSGSAHAHLHPGELVGAQVGNDVLDAVVSAGAAAAADAQLLFTVRTIENKVFVVLDASKRNAPYVLCLFQHHRSAAGQV